MLFHTHLNHSAFLMLLAEQPRLGHGVICFVLYQMIIHQKHMAVYKSRGRFSASCKVKYLKGLIMHMRMETFHFNPSHAYLNSRAFLQARVIPQISTHHNLFSIHCHCRMFVNVILIT